MQIYINDQETYHYGLQSHFIKIATTESVDERAKRLQERKIIPGSTGNQENSAPNSAKTNNDKKESETKEFFNPVETKTSKRISAEANFGPWNVLIKGKNLKRYPDLSYGFSLFYPVYQTINRFVITASHLGLQSTNFNSTSTFKADDGVTVGRDTASFEFGPVYKFTAESDDKNTVQFYSAASVAWLPVYMVNATNKLQKSYYDGLKKDNELSGGFRWNLIGMNLGVEAGYLFQDTISVGAFTQLSLSKAKELRVRYGLTATFALREKIPVEIKENKVSDKTNIMKK